MWAESVWLGEAELRPLLGLCDHGNESFCARETGISFLLCFSDCRHFRYCYASLTAVISRERVHCCLFISSSVDLELASFDERKRLKACAIESLLPEIGLTSYEKCKYNKTTLVVLGEDIPLCLQYNIKMKWNVYCVCHNYVPLILLFQMLQLVSARISHHQANIYKNLKKLIQISRQLVANI
jgi:hypothetical protein